VGTDAFLRLASALPAALGAWMAAAAFLRVFRIRDATLRAVLWTGAAFTTALAPLGVPTVGMLQFELVAPPGRTLLAGAFPAVAIAVWAAIAAALLARRIAGDARLVACVEGLAAASPVPPELDDAVDRAASWLGVTAPRIAAADGDGTAFVSGVNSPTLLVPLALWRRLDERGRRALVLHELAHVRRRDPLRLRALSYTVDALWPAFPLRWIAARLRDSWEAQADEEAVHAGATRSALARTLVAAWTSPTPSGVLAFGGDAAATVRRVGTLRRPPRAAVVAVQVLAVLWLAPWCPQGIGATSCRVDDVPGRDGVVRIGLQFGDNPLWEFTLGRAGRRLVPDSLRNAGRPKEER
jgi:hypothetical protein